jgi:tRNA threonylcarbamoyladenosine biosynthesis protein TsaE
MTDINLHNFSLSELKIWIDKFVTTELQIPALLLLEGPMGSGKTTFTRLLAKKINGDSDLVEANSPTFAIHQQYLVQKNSTQKIERIDHFDLYRLESEDDLETSGFWEVLAEPSPLLVVEWSSRITLKNWIPTGVHIYNISLN